MVPLIIYGIDTSPRNQSSIYLPCDTDAVSVWWIAFLLLHLWTIILYDSCCFRIILQVISETSPYSSPSNILTLHATYLHLNFLLWNFTYRMITQYSEPLLSWHPGVPLWLCLQWEHTCMVWPPGYSLFASLLPSWESTQLLEDSGFHSCFYSKWSLCWVIISFMSKTAFQVSPALSKGVKHLRLSFISKGMSIKENNFC